MELIRGYHNVLPRHHGCVMAIGNFDGVHRGHLHIIERLRAQAKKHDVPMLIVTFEPLPQEFFGVNKPQARLTRLREKLLILQSYQVDRVLVLRFNRALAQLSAEEFVRELLVKKLGVRYLVVGDDFRFGAKRHGDVTLLKQLGAECDFSVVSLNTLSHQQQRISSTMIREALAQGNLQQAKHLLGHAYAMSGRIVHGEKLGRQLGVPTANLFLHRHVSPLLGIYVVQVHGLADVPLKGVANIGHRPTIAGNTDALLEVHLFNFNQDIYGQYVQVEFLHKLRDEEKFTSLDELKVQMFHDIEHAKQYFVEPVTP